MRYKLNFLSDCTGKPLSIGDTVRICRAPDLTGMSEEGKKESMPVFRYAVGKNFKIQRISRYGFIEVDFSIPTGSHCGWHGIAIEPYLTRKVPN